MAGLFSKVSKFARSPQGQKLMQQAQAAAKYPKLAELRVTGVDGLPDGGRRHVDHGILAATVITPSNTGPAIRLVGQTLQGRARFPREQLLTPSSYPDVAELVARPRGGRSSP